MNKISEVTRQDIIDIIREGFTVILDEEEYDDKSDEYVTERTIKNAVLWNVLMKLISFQEYTI